MIPWSNVWKLPSMRIIVDRSNKSVLYSIVPYRPVGFSVSDSVRSNFAVPVLMGKDETVKPVISSASIGTFCKTNIT